MCVYIYYIDTYIHVILYIYTHTYMTVRMYICIPTQNTHIHTLTLYICGHSHTPETSEIIPFEMWGLCLHPKSNPYHIITVVFFSLHCSIFPVASEGEAVHPHVWRPPEVCGGRDQCWWQSPPGAGEDVTGQPSAVDGKGDDGGCLRDFWLPPLDWWLDRVPSVVGSLSCCIPCTAIFRLGTRFTVKNKPPRFCFLPHVFWR